MSTRDQIRDRTSPIWAPAEIGALIPVLGLPAMLVLVAEVAAIGTITPAVSL